MLPPDEVAHFRIYPEKRHSRLFYSVRVFRSRRAIARYLSADPHRRVPIGKGNAMCSSWTEHYVRENGSMRMRPRLGEIVFCLRAFRAGAISHECTHAALNWAKRIGISPVSDGVARSGFLMASPDEERFCYALGEMVRQISVEGWARKLLH